MPAPCRQSAGPSAPRSQKPTRASPPALRPRLTAGSGFACKRLDDLIDLGIGRRIDNGSNPREFGLRELHFGGLTTGCKNTQRHRVQQMSEVQLVVPLEAQAMDIPLLCQPDDLFLDLH